MRILLLIILSIVPVTVFTQVQINNPSESHIIYDKADIVIKTQHLKTDTVYTLLFRDDKYRYISEYKIINLRKAELKNFVDAISAISGPEYEEGAVADVLNNLKIVKLSGRATIMVVGGDSGYKQLNKKTAAEIRRKVYENVSF